MTRVLFVCLGNICRSPAAEGVFRSFAPEIQIDSAGTGDWHIGRPPYGPIQAAARARGHDLSGLRARQFTSDDFIRFNLIIAMDQSNRQDIELLRPAGNNTPVRLLTDYAPQSGMDHIPDPYYTHDFEETFDLIEQAVKGLNAAIG